MGKRVEDFSPIRYLLKMRESFFIFIRIKEIKVPH